MTEVSVLQGCALSQIWANIDGCCWAWEVESEAKVEVGGFIDDKGMRSRSWEEVQKGADASTNYHEISGQTVGPSKSAGWCTDAEKRKAAPKLQLGREEIDWVRTDKVLGVEHQFCRDKVGRLEEKRATSAEDAAERLARLPLNWELKELLGG